MLKLDSIGREGERKKGGEREEEGGWERKRERYVMNRNITKGRNYLVPSDFKGRKKGMNE